MKVDDIVCVCADITRQQIADAIANGTLGKLYNCGLSQYCGSCIYDIIELADDDTDDDNDTS